VVSGRPPEIPDVDSILGFFMNMIPVRVRFSKEIEFKSLLRLLHDEATLCKPHQYSPLTEIQAQSVLKRKLLDHGMVFENVPFFDRLKSCVSGSGNGKGMKLLDTDIVQQSNYDFVVIVAPIDELTVRFNYNRNVYEEKTIKKIARQMEEVIDFIIDDECIEIGDIKISKDLVAAKSDVLQQAKQEFRF